MAPKKSSGDSIKDEEPMTDLQFSAYVEIRDKYEGLLQEVIALRVAAEKRVEGDSDYQFKQYEEMRDRVEELSKEIVSLRRENARLRMQEDMFRNSHRKYRI